MEATSNEALAPSLAGDCARTQVARVIEKITALNAIRIGSPIHPNKFLDVGNQKQLCLSVGLGISDVENSPHPEGRNVERDLPIPKTAHTLPDCDPPWQIAAGHRVD